MFSAGLSARPRAAPRSTPLVRAARPIASTSRAPRAERLHGLRQRCRSRIPARARAAPARRRRGGRRVVDDRRARRSASAPPRAAGRPISGGSPPISTTSRIEDHGTAASAAAGGRRRTRRRVRAARRSPSTCAGRASTPCRASSAADATGTATGEPPEGRPPAATRRTRRPRRAAAPHALSRGVTGRRTAHSSASPNGWKSTKNATPEEERTRRRRRSGSRSAACRPIRPGDAHVRRVRPGRRAPSTR